MTAPRDKTPYNPAATVWQGEAIDKEKQRWMDNNKDQREIFIALQYSTLRAIYRRLERGAHGTSAIKDVSSQRTFIIYKSIDYTYTATVIICRSVSIYQILSICVCVSDATMLGSARRSASAQCIQLAARNQTQPYAYPCRVGSQYVTLRARPSIIVAYQAKRQPPAPHHSKECRVGQAPHQTTPPHLPCGACPPPP